MRKFIKFTLLIFILLVLAVGFLKFAFYYLNKNLFKLDDETAEKYINEVKAYLNNKYKEEMVIYDYGYYETFFAQVYPKNNSELKFMVYGWRNEEVVYKDNYVETYLEYTSRKKIETILNMYYKDYELTQELNLLPPGTSSEYYYNKYKDIQLPISWDNSKCEEFFNELIVDVFDEKEITNNEKEEIKEKISETGIKFKNLIIKSNIRENKKYCKS